MKYIINRFAFILLFTLSASFIFANDEVTFTCEAPNTIANGSTFQLVYTVTGSGKDLRMPEIKDFDIVAGPFKSSSSNVQVINGKMTSSKSERYTYTLLAQKEGTFTIPSASIVVSKQKYQSNAVTIKVIPADKSTNAAQGSQGNNSNQVGTSQQITAENLFIKPSISRTKVMEQEAVLLTYKIYSRVDLMDVQSVKFPDFKGFLVQEIEMPQTRQQELENYNGKNYYTYVLRQVLLFPQRSGDIVIDPMSCEAVVRIRTQRQVRSIFDDFFDSFQEVRKPLSSGKVTIDVSPLPLPKPTEFSGAVGEFNINSSINTSTVNVNEPITITIKISGAGNMKMVKTPEIQFPADFETYEPKISNNFTNTPDGVKGTKTIEYLAIPRHDGSFNIPGITFSYYDINSKSYRTLTTAAYNIAVNKSTSSIASDVVTSNYSNQEKVRHLATDIRYISTAPIKFIHVRPVFVGSSIYWFSLILPLLIAAALAFFFRKQARESADAALMRNKKANKLAQKRLKVAEKEWKQGNKDRFYDEIFKALWGYLGDKLSLPVADLNKENVESILVQRQVPTEIINEFMTLLNNCEFERYAPLQNTQAAMDNIYAQAIKVITSLENSISK